MPSSKVTNRIMSYVLIIGAKGDIAKALAKKYASSGYNLYLAAIKSKELKDFAQDLNIRYQVKTQCLDFNILTYHKHVTFYASLKEKPEGVISAVGYLGEQKKSEINFEEMNKIISTGIFWLKFASWLSSLSSCHKIKLTKKFWYKILIYA